MIKKNKKIIEELFEKGILLNQDLLDQEIDPSLFKKIELESDLLVLNSDYAQVIHQQTSLVDWYDMDSYRVKAEQERDDELYQSHLQLFKESNLVVDNKFTENKSGEQTISSLEAKLSKDGSNYESITDETKNDQLDDVTQQLKPLISESITNSTTNSTINIIISHNNIPKKYTVKDFSKLFVSRYKFLEKILQNRQELKHPVAIGRLVGKKERETVSMIGIIQSIAETKAGNLIVTIEDLTGSMKILISKNKKELYLQGKDLILDEIIGVVGIHNEDIVFAENLVWPDVPNNSEIKKSEVDEYVLFLSDIHVGSKSFLKDEFNKFLKWINCESGNDAQRQIAKKVKYIFIAGDLVDGVGIYPSQEEELEIKDITLQYKEFSRLIKKIPSTIPIIICPGNHDAVHLAEPQPAFNQKFSYDLFDIPNVTLVTNPSLINIGKTESFEGFNVLMYHGYSFDYYVANVESIRTSGGYHRSDLIMKFLLKRRHLAPSFKSTPYYPAHLEDPLLIKNIPDIFITGHIHYSCVANYKGITMISGSCWQGKTLFQEKLGHEPEPARVPLVNLKTREIKILKF
jgi:DNA polymerase II small subunit